MNQITSIADGSNQAEQAAAGDAAAIQDAVNLVAIVGCFHRHLLALHKAGICGDDLNNPPVSLAFISKLNSLCRMTTEREMAAFSAIDKLGEGEPVDEYGGNAEWREEVRHQPPIHGGKRFGNDLVDVNCFERLDAIHCGRVMG